ncbi:hypothetical protein [Clostridium neonatale]|uniref:Uncharacterized protein n=1 Tax=Clostridium neonatale TaxID=137838 RepID=A0AAD1YJH3_9CLOT|nr:hypothetical protein [Clostridium neonatale]MBP8312811.1 hypothetical protein [Clostridium neonatale]CAI3195250.1 conserved hypothetical protein [Clostridium neonatale]CAI3214076.1 conserved hypothetical protein [Clostridium neonatale]CAI3216169.1 conserved hypothetical protein [Clostridium neonatale]CAI3216687.1 conserved hypothetical protein [Clostridium neonatale]
MNIKLFQKLINELIEEGVQVHKLTLLQISYSLNLYKKLYRSMGVQ